MTALPVLEGPAPRVFGLPPGADFAAELVAGLATRMRGRPPEDWARVTVWLPTPRMRRRIVEVLDAGPPRLLPRLRLVADLGLDPAGADLAPPVPALRRRLELSRLIAALLEREPDLAPRARLFDLADSLASLMEEMQAEGVPPAVLAGLDVGDLSGHWARSLSFLRLLEPWFSEEGAPDVAARRRRVAERLTRLWRTDPPEDPVIVAGATGTRGTTALLMRAVAKLPQGAVVLPAYDFDLPGPVWGRLEDALAAEDHPQFRFARLLADLDLDPAQVPAWTATPAPCPPRARLVSLSLRPPPVTDQWLTEGPGLGPLGPACEGLTLVEAPSPRAEAEAIALRLRQAIEDGETAALVTSDRGLARMVAAALDRWDVAADDSAGLPLPLSPPGRLLRQVAELLGARASGEALLALLKHPLCHAGPGAPGGRGAHLARAHALELRLRRHGPPEPGPATLLSFGAREAERDPGAPGWAAWLADLLGALAPASPRPLAAHLALHVELAERLALGPGGPGDGNPLWQEAAGRAARAACDELVRHADAGGVLSARDYAALFDGVLGAAEVRDRDRGHPQALVWGTLEAQAQTADLVILGGMAEGVWPPAPPADPWLNRRMREAAGLSLPEARIGLAAHDYMQAVGARRAWITRSLRDAEAPTTPSRWLVRLVNLLDGLPGQGGPAALEAMRARGQEWLDRAEALNRPAAAIPPAPRPSPRPPVAARPRRLAVTAIERLIRDPYAVYAESVLRLPALDPLTAAPDAAERGTLMHRALEAWVEERHPFEGPEARAALMAVAARVLEEECPWPAMRRFWLAQVDRVADWFLDGEAGRRRDGRPAHVEAKGEAVVAVPLAAGTLEVTLVAKADRIDLRPDGRLVVLDYKTGKVPGEADQRAHAKQLLVLAAMAERGAFAAGAAPVSHAAFIGLGADARVVRAPLDATTTPAQVWQDLTALLGRWADPGRGYSARMGLGPGDREGPYDHLARFGEWDHADAATPIDLG